MGHIYVNPNPLGKKVGDCTIRAISLALDRTWDSVYVELCLYGFIFKDMPSTNSVWDSLLRDHGFKRYMIPDSCPECYTVKDFCRDHPEGLYVLGIGNHVVTVKNGSYLDTWDSGEEVPIYFYKKEK